MSPFESTVTWIVGVAAVLTALGVIWRKAVRPIIRAVSTLHQTYESVQATKGAIEQMEKRTAAFVTREEFQAELKGVYQQLASRDVVEAAVKAAETVDHFARAAAIPGTVERKENR